MAIWRYDNLRKWNLAKWDLTKQEFGELGFGVMVRYRIDKLNHIQRNIL
jgi:hypothetical protein